MDLSDYLSAGYTITRRVPRPSWSCPRLLPDTLASASPCLGPRVPDTWCIEWTGDTRVRREAQARELGLSARDLDALTRWVTERFERTIGWPNICFDLDTARELDARLPGPEPDRLLIGLRVTHRPAPVAGNSREGYGSRVKRTALAATTLALSMAPVLLAHSHVAPSRDTNNRYLKLAPMRDRVRLAYTVFLGELPGAQARKRMDSDRDGRLDDQEIDAFARPLADSVRQNLELTVDGTAQALSWSEVHAGLGTPVTQAGAFSVDLIGWLCLPGDAAGHRITLRDRFRVPMPGETELHVQASPGIEITGSAIGSGSQAAKLAFQWKGSEIPLATEGYTLAFTVDPETAPLPAGGPCGPPRPHTAQPGRTAGMVLLLALLMLGGAWAGWRWRKARALKVPGRR